MNDNDGGEEQRDDEFFAAGNQAAEDFSHAVPGELVPVPWLCAGCGRPNETLADFSSGYKQQYVEDCAVCCRPNLITLLIDEESLRIFLDNELEYE